MPPATRAPPFPCVSVPAVPVARYPTTRTRLYVHHHRRAYVEAFLERKSYVHEQRLHSLELYWRDIATRVDYYSRIWMPIFFSCSLLWCFTSQALPNL